MSIVAVIISALAISIATANFRPPPRLYYCDENFTCQPHIPENLLNSDLEAKSLDICRLTCGPYGSLWPKPTGDEPTLGPNTVPVDLDNVWLRDLSFVNDMGEIFEVVKSRWLNFHRNMPGVYTGKNMIITVNISKPFQRLKILKTDESYALRIWTEDCNREWPPNDQRIDIQVNISAGSIFGARHALETLSQLMAYDHVAETLRLACDVAITDAPKFAYRGLLLDVARNFYPLYSLRHLVDAMSYNKFNVLHMHLTDSTSFPVQIRSQPNMTFYGAYGPYQVYSDEDLKDLVRYAYLRGVTILPEIDAPAHVAYGWQWTPNSSLGEILMCLEKKGFSINYVTCFGSPCGILNPTNPNTYKILKDIYSEMLDIFGDKFDMASNFFHIGADEVDFKCWQESDAILAWLRRFGLPTVSQNNEGMFEVWSYFEKQAMKVLTEANDGHKPWTVIWSSKLTNDKKLTRHLREQKSRVVVEYWGRSTEDTVKQLVHEDFKVIIANADAWYLDCGVGSYVGEGPNWCKYNDWRRMYNNQLLKGPDGQWSIDNPQEKARVLGGEGCAWSESISPVNMDQRIWPRASAIAERLWSDPESCWYSANGRFMAHRDRMVNLGVAADMLEPEWCTQNENYCRVEPENYQENGVTSTCPEFRWANAISTNPTPSAARVYREVTDYGHRHTFSPALLLLLGGISVLVLCFL